MLCKFLTILREITQCVHFRIFLSLRFCVKSIMENLDVLELLFFGILDRKFCLAEISVICTL